MDAGKLTIRIAQGAGALALIGFGAIVVPVALANSGDTADNPQPVTTVSVTVEATPSPVAVPATTEAPAPVAPAAAETTEAPVTQQTSPAYVPPAPDQTQEAQPATEPTPAAPAPAPIPTMGQPNPYNPDAPPIGIVTPPTYENGASNGSN